jgi:argininosuccinate lyase
VVLAEQKLAPPEAISCLMKAVDTMEAEGAVEARARQWNVIHGGEEYMRKHCGEENSGWLHLGRSSPSIRVVASRIAFRKLQMQIMASVNDLRGGYPRRSLHPAPQTLAARSGGPGCRSRRPAQTVSKAVSV